MSHNELHIGKLKPIDLQGLSVEEWCEQYYKNNPDEFNDFRISDTYLEEVLQNGLYDYKFIIVNDNIFELIEHQEYDDNYINEIYENLDGTYSFTSSFYNGGTCLEECLEELLEKVFKNKDKKEISWILKN